MENTTGIAQELENFLNNRENDSASWRAELAEFCVETIYKFVKFNRSEGEGLDGRDGPERQGLGEVLDAAKNHKFDIGMAQMNKKI
ncbi:hypothetical protein [Pantoea agglomerans]|uniref:hypothetical protein n=1 Tax=Enterobacter agglomerans TaxID=549 RepID=UPI001F5B1646|nr:hypothetical protein [Pantoea agglomerans]